MEITDVAAPAAAADAADAAAAVTTTTDETAKPALANIYLKTILSLVLNNHKLTAHFHPIFDHNLQRN